jgi:NADPH2 dehydrogenase
MAVMGESNLFTPVNVGRAALAHRVVMAPMTRRRAAEEHVPSSLMIDYYSQRASIPGTLIISESTAITPKSASLPNTPGIWNQTQINAWNPITAAVHAKGSFIYLQLWMCGRAARPGAVKRGAEVISSGDIAIGPEQPIPRPVTEEEIEQLIKDFAQAARNAVDAGFDGVELHGANGYILDQFTQDVCNNRTDQWGGSIENCSRFPVAVARAVADAIGADRVGYRVSPWSRHHGMRMDDPIPQFSHLVGKLKHLKLSYLHVIESRVQGPLDVGGSEPVEFLAELWGETSPIIFAGGYNAESSREKVDEQQGLGRESLIAFGRTFVSNPDLPLRVKEFLPITKYIRDLFYEVGKTEGYVDYPSWEEEKKSDTMQDLKHVWPTGLASSILK